MVISRSGGRWSHGGGGKKGAVIAMEGGFSVSRGRGLLTADGLRGAQNLERCD